MSKKVFRIICNYFADGGGEFSSRTLMTMAMKMGYHVVFNPTKGINKKLPLPKGVEIGPSMESGKAEGDSDCLVFYGNDAVYRMIQVKERWIKLFKASKRNTIVLNFTMGESWQDFFSEHINRYLFLNRTKEFELVKRFKDKDMPPKPTLSMPPPVDLTKYLELALPDYSRINFGRTGRYNGKYDEEDYLYLIEKWMELTPESHYYSMPTPPFLKKKYGKDKRFHLYSWNEIPIHESLRHANLFHYRCPTRLRDQGPRVIVESMARGMPCIGEPRDGALDRITDETGWLRWDNEGFVEVVKEIIENPGLLEKKGKAARERARNEFNPFRWLCHITGEDIPEEVAGVHLKMESDEELIAAQDGLLSREAELFEWKKRFKGFKEKKDKKKEKPKREYEKHDVLGFGEGNLRQQEWDSILDYMKSKETKKVLDIGGAYSCVLFKSEGCDVKNLDNRAGVVQILKEAEIDSAYYDYPDFPEVEEKFDLALVAGPGPNNHDGRKSGLEFAKQHADTIFLRDSLRKAEAAAAEECLSEKEWSRKNLPMGLALFEKRG